MPGRFRWFLSLFLNGILAQDLSVSKHERHDPGRVFQFRFNGSAGEREVMVTATGVFLVLMPEKLRNIRPRGALVIDLPGRVPLKIIAGLALADHGRLASNLGDKASIFLGIIQIVTRRRGYKRPA